MAAQELAALRLPDLAQELVGKSFAVTDDGYLKRIRAAQFSNDMTRVVLDVNDVTEYSAFLLPNPYRLIIDIHGGSKAQPGAPGVSVPMQRAAQLGLSGDLEGSVLIRGDQIGILDELCP